MSLSKRLRFEVFKRDSFTCQYCGAHPPEIVLEVDHVMPVSKGGSTDISNLVTACFPCNRGKSAVLLSSVPKSLQATAKEIQEREDQLAGYQAIMAARVERLEQEVWQVIEMLQPGSDNYPKNNFLSIKRFIEQLGLFEVLEAADIATAKWSGQSRTFRYFCGVCWTKIRRRQENVQDARPKY